MEKFLQIYTIAAPILLILVFLVIILKPEKKYENKHSRSRSMGGRGYR